MLHSPIWEAEYKRRISSGAILIGLMIFVMALILLAGNVKLYELRQESLQLEETLEKYEEALEELEQEAYKLPSLYQRAKDLGLQKIDPEEVQVLHVRGQMTD